MGIFFFLWSFSSIAEALDKPNWNKISWSCPPPCLFLVAAAHPFTLNNLTLALLHWQPFYYRWPPQVWGPSLCSLLVSFGCDYFVQNCLLSSSPVTSSSHWLPTTGSSGNSGPARFPGSKKENSVRWESNYPKLRITYVNSVICAQEREALLFALLCFLELRRQLLPCKHGQIKHTAFCPFAICFLLILF